MMPPPLSVDEPFRLAALRSTQLLDTPLEERFERITRLACKLLKVPMSNVSLVDATRQWFKSARGANRAETSRDVSFCGHTILEGDGVMVVPDARKDVRFIGNPLVEGKPRMVAYAGCSITTEDGCRVGVLCVGDTKPRDFTPDEMEALRDLAAMAQDELRATVTKTVQAELLSQIAMEQRKAMLDPLTRIWNREGLEMMLYHAMRNARKNGEAIGVIMIDLDHFKRVNDTYGHAAGDEVLKQAAKRILGVLRPEDAIGRHGGEEFVVVLSPCESRDAAMSMAERIRAELSRTPMTMANDAAITVTASLGVVFEIPSSKANEADLLARADAAMYLAKAGGRDRAEFAEAGLRKAG